MNYSRSHSAPSLNCANSFPLRPLMLNAGNGSARKSGICTPPPMPRWANELAKKQTHGFNYLTLKGEVSTQEEF